MKLALSIILITCLLINYSNCLNNGSSKCFKLGEACKHSVSIDVSCGEHLACLPLDENNESSKYVCKPRLKLGEKCNNEVSDVCERGLNCLPSVWDDINSNYTCIEAGFAGEGEDCDSNYTCIGTGYLNLKCVDSKCKIQEFEGNDNITCEGFYNCPGPFTCASVDCENREDNCLTKCVPLKQLGSYCDQSSECLYGGICSIENTCISRYSKKLDENCLYNSECDFGLRCETTIYHYFPNGTFDYLDEINKCVPLVYSNTTNCMEEGCLSQIEFCNGATNTCYPKKKYTNDCKEAEKERDLCYASNNCFFSSDYSDFIFSDSSFSNEHSCQMKHCKQQTINYFKQCQNSYTFCD
ncbi:hypothetical protein RB653_000122 [Dictyostelium firmibasis]|uniref:Dickkopf N-terminal cysteine-rich domain-containing protein n=1 Tax=Dictyostelium firmibasis TaxID=79012 RepID=A0AAN7TUT1_9MYCE